MELTRQQAITEHRKMWNWIANDIEQNGWNWENSIENKKKEYLVLNGYGDDIYADCFCCHYVEQRELNCLEQCLLNWGKSSCCNEDAPYWKLYKLTDLDLRDEGEQPEATEKRIVSLCREIANLPEKTEKRR